MLNNIELVEEVLHLQNTVMFLQAQLQEARKMNEHTDFYVGLFTTMHRVEQEREYAQQLIGRMCAAPLVVVYDERDELVHTDEHPFCGDETCPCMDELYDEVERREQEVS